MFHVPSSAWPTILLAAILFGDALISVVPVKLVRDCYRGVGFPADWGWALVYIKLLAVAGLLVGLWQPGVGVAATAGVVAYFVAASIAHVKAGFRSSTFWVNCLGMLVFSVAVLVYSYVV